MCVLWRNADVDETSGIYSNIGMLIQFTLHALLYSHETHQSPFLSKGYQNDGVPVTSIANDFQYPFTACPWNYSEPLLTHFYSGQTKLRGK